MRIEKKEAHVFFNPQSEIRIPQSQKGVAETRGLDTLLQNPVVLSADGKLIWGAYSTPT